jgi:shikimate kinase
MIDHLSSKANIVLATGGGAVLASESRVCLSSRGVVVYLHASISQQLQRTSRDKSRPLLQTSDRRGKILALMEFREPFYREIADIVIDADKGNPKSIAAKIVKGIQNF